MKNWISKITHSIYFLPIVGAVICFLALLLLISLYESQHREEETLRMEYIARTVEAETYETLSYQLGKTKVLEAHLIETGGNFDNFGPIAEGLLKEPCVRNLLFAPGGVVKGIFPMEGNEPVYDLDMNGHGLGNLEAQAAIQKGELYMAGPFEMVEGGLGICGRLPIYLQNQNGERAYWGLVSITLSYPEIFDNGPMQHINEQGYTCRVWRINPDDNKAQTVLETATPVDRNAVTLSRQMELFNSEWTLDIAPLNPWHSHTLLCFLLLADIAVSTLAGMGLYLNGKVRRMKAEEAATQIRLLQEQLEQEQTHMLLSQISSHFFYHTLNALQALIVLQPDAAYKMAGDFSRYLRFNLDSITAKNGMGTFKDELRAIRAYADINVQQLGDRLQMKYNVPDVDFDIPTLTIQPVVENAILHGIKPKIGGGTVSITLQEMVAYWQVTVADDGVGFSLDAAENNKSVGLDNVRKRLSRFDGCFMTIESQPGVGTKVVLRFAKNYDN